MAIDKERHDKGERDFLYIVGAKLNESRRKKKLKQHDVVSMLEEKYQYKTSAQHISDLENGNGNLKLYEVAILCSIYEISIEEILRDCKREYAKGLLPSYNRQRKPNMTKDELEKLADKLEKEFREICDLLR